MDTVILGALDNPLYEFKDTDHDIISITYTNSVDVVGAELTIDILTPTVDYPFTPDSAQVIGGVDFDCIESTDGYILCSNKQYFNLRTIPYGTLVYYYRDGNLLVKAYVKNIDRVGVGTFRINAISAIGLLDAQKHAGGIYTGQTFAAVLSDIIDSAVDYTIADDVASVIVYGWLPYDTKRANLHQLLFAFGVMVGRNANGDMDFRFISNESPTAIPSSRIYINGSVDYSSPATAVEVTEYTYIALGGDEAVTEFDNTDGSETANNTLVVFKDAPLHDLTATGTLVINESGVNYAIITGTGTLTGHKYTQSTRTLTKISPDAGSQRENVVTSDKCTLVTVTNSDNVAARLLAYYGSKKTVSSSVVMDGESAGMMVTATDAFGETISGFVNRIDAVVSHIIKGAFKIITDYIPVSGNNYTKSYTYTGSGNIDFAALVAGKATDLVQVSLIQGGHGGYSGENGETLSTPWYAITDRSGHGGAGGQGGEGGKVLTVSFHVSDLAQTTLAYSCGAGGVSDTDGGETTLGIWSSANGAIPPNGITDIFANQTYALSGSLGANGGDGQGRDGTRPILTYQQDGWIAGAQGQPYQNSAGTGFGGLGGGAAVGSNGNTGGNGWANYNGDVFGGNGGAGANGGAGDNADQYGCGGMGGHGGGGGGGNGAARGEPNRWDVGRCGVGGAGGAGGIGGAGLVLVLV